MNKSRNAVHLITYFALIGLGFGLYTTASWATANPRQVVYTESGVIQKNITTFPEKINASPVALGFNLSESDEKVRINVIDVGDCGKVKLNHWVATVEYEKVASLGNNDHYDMKPGNNYHVATDSFHCIQTSKIKFELLAR